MLKKFLIGTFALALVVSVGAMTADAFSGATLKQGSKGADVMELQTKLGLTADGSFGPMTKAALMAFQASNGLTADGVAGPITLAKLVGMAVIGTYPAGCTSSVGFSSLTGLSCAGTVGTFPAGCTSAVGFSSTTGAKCDGTTGGTTPTTVTGGAGDAELTHYSTSEKSTIDEGEEGVKVLGFKVEAIDSDVSVTFVKVMIDKGTQQTVGSSQKITDYVDSVDIYKGATKVGGVDASDFSRDTNTDPDMYSKSIAVSNTVVKEGDKDPFYVVFNAIGDLNEDEEAEELDVEIDSFRFLDGTGMSFTNDPIETVSNSVEFNASTTSVDLKSSTSNPDDDSVLVVDNDISDEVLALAFKLDVDQDSSDVKITELPVKLTFTENDEASDVDWAETVIDSVVVKFMGEEYTADLSFDDTLADGTGTATYLVDLTDEEVVLSGDDVEEAKVYITFAEQENAYSEDMTVTASVLKASILAEDTDEETVPLGGANQIGAELTLKLAVPTVTITAVTPSKNEASTVGTYTFDFTIKATDGDVTFDTDLVAGDLTYEVVSGGTATAAAEINYLEDYEDEGAGNVYTIVEGEETTFTVDVTLSDVSAATTYRVKILTIAGITVDKLSASLALEPEA